MKSGNLAIDVSLNNQSQDETSYNKKIQSFLQYIEIYKNLSQNTILSYKYDLIDFNKFCNISKISIINANEEDFESYLGYLFKLRIKSSSANRKLSAIKSFIKFCKSNSNILAVKSLKKPRSLPIFLNTDEIHILLQTASKNNEPNGIRFYAILAMLYDTGMRVTECLSLKLQDINESLEIIVKGKGGKERLVFLTEQSKLALEKYMLIRNHFLKQSKQSNNLNNDYLFCSRSLNVNNKIHKHYTRENFFQSIKKLANICKIDERKVSPHKIRHSFATHLYNAGVGISTLQEALGHSDISTTQIYTHLNTEQLKNALSKNHPFSQKKQISSKCIQ